MVTTSWLGKRQRMLGVMSRSLFSRKGVGAGIAAILSGRCQFACFHFSDFLALIPNYSHCYHCCHGQNSEKGVAPDWPWPPCMDTVRRRLRARLVEAGLAPRAAGLRGRGRVAVAAGGVADA